MEEQKKVYGYVITFDDYKEEQRFLKTNSKQYFLYSNREERDRKFHSAIKKCNRLFASYDIMLFNSTQQDEYLLDEWITATFIDLVEDMSSFH